MNDDATAVPNRAVRRRKFLLLTLAFLLPLAACLTVRLCMLDAGGENSLDGFYHAKMAKLGPSVILDKKFPWHQMSVWKDVYADKEMVYHLVLWAVFRVQNAFGFDPEPPFHLAAGLFIALASLAYVFAAYRLGVKPALILAGSLLFCLISPNWVYRLTMLRPHVLAIAALLFVIGVMAKGTLRRRLIVLGIVAFFFAWTYSNPHFIVIPALAFAVFQCRFRRTEWQVLLIPAVMLVLVLLGLVIHPQFPNSFAIWKLQSWDALVTPMQASVKLSKPTEMEPPGFRWQVTVIPVYLFAYLALLMHIRLTERLGFRAGPLANLHAVGLLALMFAGGIFLAQRSIEYGAPLVCLWFLLAFQEYRASGLAYPFRAWSERSSRLRYLPEAMIFLAALSLGLFSATRSVLDGRNAQNRPARQVADWLRDNVKKGDCVLNLDWSDFPRLFYADSDHYYYWGMDPVFAYAAQPGRTLLLTRSRNPNERLVTSREVFRAFGVRYAVVLFPRYQHADYLARNGWKIVREFKNERDEPEGWIFTLDPVEASRLPRITPSPLPPHMLRRP